MIATARPNFFTYAKQAIAAKAPNENVHFATGHGYYLVPQGGNPAPPGFENPPPTKPTPSAGTDPRTGLPKTPYSPPARPTPPAAAYPAGIGAATPDQINAQAGLVAQSQLTPQQDEIRRQQALAEQQAQADYGAITGLGTAAAGILKDIAPAAGDAYQRAADAEAQYGQGLAAGVRDDVASRVAADSAFMQSQGQQGGSGPDVNALHDTVYSLDGRIPGDTLAEQGAAAAAWGLAQPAISLNASREQLDARMAQAKTENDNYAQQLIQVAAQYPGLKAQALQQLNQYELDKANYRLNAMHTQKSDALATRSEKAQEIAAGIDTKIKQGTLAYKWASLTFQSQKEAGRAQAAAAKGKTIDVSASKLLGHIVYKDGTQDTSIKVAQSGSATAASKVKAASKARTTAYNYAVTLLGKPVAAPKGSKGAYIAAPGANPGSTFAPLYPGGPKTTNNPKYASRAGSAAGYQDAVEKVWAEIDGDGLVQSGYSHQEVMAWIKAALNRAGWKRK